MGPVIECMSAHGDFACGRGERGGNGEWLLMGINFHFLVIKSSGLDCGTSCILCDYTENHWIVNFEKWILWYENSISNVKKSKRGREGRKKEVRKETPGLRENTQVRNKLGMGWGEEGSQG